MAGSDVVVQDGTTHTAPTMDVDIDLRAVFLHMSNIHRRARERGNERMTVNQIRALTERRLRLPNRALLPYQSVVQNFLDLLKGAHLLFMVPPPRHTYCPIANLPVEILSSIFIHVVQEWEERAMLAILSRDSLKSRQLTAFLRVITSVCTFWRSVAFTTPALWTNVFGPYGAQYGTSWHKALAFSGAAPLKVWGDAGFGTVDTLSSTPFRPHEHRVRSVYTMDRALLHNWGVTIPVSTSWSNLRSLTIVRGYGTSLLRNILSSLETPRSLQQLRLSLFRYRDDSPDELPITMFSLEHLALEFYSSFELESFLDMLLCPVLRNLVLIKRDRPYPTLALPFLNNFGLLRDHFSSLHVLSIGGAFSAEHALSVIIRLPHARALKLFDLDRDHHLDDILTGLLYGGCLPYLQDLYVDDAQSRQYSPAISQLLRFQQRRTFRKLAVARATFTEIVRLPTVGDALHNITIWETPAWDILRPL